MPGRSVRPGTKRWGAGSRFSPTKPLPTSPDRPRPKIVRARPEATWLTAKTTVSSANSSRHQGADGQDARQGADERRARHVGGREAAGRAHHHHALDAEVQHARSLGHEFADARR